MINSTENAAAAGNKETNQEILIIERTGPQSGALDSSNVTLRIKDEDARKSPADELRQTQLYPEKNIAAETAQTATGQDSFITMYNAALGRIVRDPVRCLEPLKNGRQRGDRKNHCRRVYNQTCNHPLSKELI